jgi:hypothetical protein
MKKIIALAISILSLSFVATSAEAKARPAAMTKSAITRPALPQIRIRIGQNRHRSPRFNHVRTVTETRIVRYGRHAFRDTYLISIWPNGRRESKLISRVRIS